MLSSLISLYYYLTIVRQMYIEPLPDWAREEQDGSTEKQGKAAPSILITALLGALVLGVIVVGVYPFPLLEAIKAATGALLS